MKPSAYYVKGTCWVPDAGWWIRAKSRFPPGILFIGIFLLFFSLISLAANALKRVPPHCPCLSGQLLAAIAVRVAGSSRVQPLTSPRTALLGLGGSGAATDISSSDPWKKKVSGTH